MAVLKSETTEKSALEMGASTMALSARTAPKARGIHSWALIVESKEGVIARHPGEKIFSQFEIF